MGSPQLPHDPFNVIISGVGGQGNVMASRVLGNMLTLKGLNVTIGETFGASQRGGSVMSHLRVSAVSAWSPQIPRGQAHVVVALEPIEALRVLKDYGNPETRALCNSRPIQPVGVICGDLNYPALEDIRQWLAEMTGRTWLINATEKAMALGHPIFGNIIMIGALAGTGLLPLERDDFASVLARSMTSEKVTANLAAYDTGAAMVSTEV